MRRTGATIILCAVSAWAAATSVTLQPVVDGLDRPDFVTHAGDGSRRLFILEQHTGQILIFQQDTTGGGSLLPTPFLDLGGRISQGGEQGLLGLAFHPGYASNGRFFVHYTDLQGNTVIAEHHRSENPNLADPSETVILRQTQPFENHNGGMIVFGPDGFLYIGLGDGGGAGDPQGNAQNINSLLGKILRIDVDHGAPYTSPPGNPFSGATPGRDEIFAWGFRNPWRFSFDRGGTHRLFCGDVGQGRVEEIVIVTNGGNYGWNILEGDLCFNPPSGCDPAGKVPPIATYTHDLGCSVTGGYVYRGTLAPSLIGLYVFGDFCSGRIWTLEETRAGNFAMSLLLDTDLSITSFGEDEAGELYVCSFATATVATGQLLRFRASSALPDLTGQWISQPVQNCRPVPAGQRCTLQASLSLSTGQAPARGSLVRIYLSDDAQLSPATDLLVRTFPTGRFRLGAQPRVRDLRIRLPLNVNASGRFLIAQLDATERLEESNEQNNIVVIGPIQ